MHFVLKGPVFVNAMTFTRRQILCVVSISAIGLTVPSCVSKKQNAKAKQTETVLMMERQDWASFIHSSYVEPYRVVREKAIESKILAASSYRVLGSITSDALFIEKWLLKKEIVTRAA